MKSITLKIRGQRWKVVFCKRAKDKGTCDYIKRVITLSLGKNHKDRLNTIIHEVLHAGYEDMSESAIGEMADAIDGAIKSISAMGYLYL
jgi:hypothetical protein